MEEMVDVDDCKREIDIVLDDNGNEVEPPTKIWWDSGNKAGGGGKGKGGGGKSWDSWGGDCRNNRSRSHRSWSMPIGSGSSSSTNLTLANGGGVPLSSDVYISRIELDHCIDCISRPDLWRDIPFNQATNSWMCKSRQQLPASYSFDDWWSDDALEEEARRAREHMIPWCFRGPPDGPGPGDRKLWLIWRMKSLSLSTTSSYNDDCGRW